MPCASFGRRWGGRHEGESLAPELRRPSITDFGKSPLMLRVALLASVLAYASAHASLIMPPTRNAVDAELPAWSNGKRKRPRAPTKKREKIILRASISAFCLAAQTIRPPCVRRSEHGLDRAVQLQVRVCPSVLRSMVAVSYTHLTLPTTPYV